MYFYFSADYPAVLKVNGVYQGEITKSVKKVDVDCDCAFIEFCPLVPTQKFLSFLLNEQFILSPTENFAVTDLNGGYLIKGLKNHTYSDFRVLCQQKYNDAVVTVFTENTLKITIESTTDFLAETVAFSAYDAKIHRFDLDGSNFICIEFIGEQTLLAVYDLNLNKQFFRLVDGFSFDGGFTTTQKYFDIAEEEEEEYLSSEEESKIRRELNHLGYITREVLIRYYYGNQSVADIAEGLTGGKADAALAASIFHFGEITVGDLKQELKRLNIDVRC